MRIFFNLILIFLVFFSIGTETYNYVYGDIHPSILNEKSKLNRLIFYYSYFTVQSNIAVGISSLLLLFKPDYSKKMVSHFKNRRYYLYSYYMHRL